MTVVLHIFARYPEQGKCKTRLIAELGADGAATLHEQMTRHTLAWAAELNRQNPIKTVLQFAGADATAMSRKFGTDVSYSQQVHGDLGEKMRAAVTSSFEAGADRVAIVGTDCPQLDSPLASKAFQLLRSHEVCLAPASDGGYTLVGIAKQSLDRNSQLLDALFSDIPWGTEQVLHRSLTRLVQVDAVVGLLKTCSDVDVPADLASAHLALSGQRHVPFLSVVLPVLGSEERLRDAIVSTKTDEYVEVIVVAARHASEPRGADAQTLATVTETASQLIISTANRALQMNQGAAHASGEVLLFLHADTILPDGYLAEIRSLLGDSQNIGGAFRLSIDSPGLMMRCIEAGVQLRSQLLRLPYGDQAIFVRQQVFEELGGFKELPIMEDYEFVRRLKRRGRMVLASRCVSTSSRRWKRLGPLQATFKNQLMLAGYHLGVSTERLAAFYRKR